MWLWDSVSTLPILPLVFFAIALAVAFGFEFINGFHDTANAVTTVIYTRTLPATPAVVYSGVMNFLGVITAGTGVAFGVVNLLPVDLLIDRAGSPAALLMVLSLLLAGVAWNLGTWYVGLPVSSSHTLIGSILGVGLANSLLEGKGLNGVSWDKAIQTFMFLFITPLIGFVSAMILLFTLKRFVRTPRLYKPPEGDDRPPGWIRTILIATCGGVSFAHGSNDGQKGMGLLVLVLLGFLPFHYALDTAKPDRAREVREALPAARERIPAEKMNSKLEKDFATAQQLIDGKDSFTDLEPEDRWKCRQALYRISKALPKDEPEGGPRATLTKAVEFVPLWVKICTAFALGIGTMVGYRRIVVTVAERVGKQHLTYAQGAVAEFVAAMTIYGADMVNAPVSTTQILTSGVAGTMVANGTGVQPSTVRKILLAWLMTLPATTLLAGTLFAIGRLFV
ncbi:inorganic phosphate transporter [Limnoglobus roseus]|uniref:Phosphate transporter n=1 Tax=Limnoglobus roseus TaxID=2598579 RepID=A0A5C1A522_9BACT|nr:inorganic phosphate transporter [Limnoglobus roseus]QEL14211.1 inorganic phosphate transporter [Limnoglobus roseus]